MRNVTALWIAALVLGSSAAWGAKMPKGSFLNRPVTNVPELRQQVIDDAVVAARYAKHFRTSRNTVVDYFQANLRTGRLKHDYECTVYSIAGRTIIVARQKSLAKGTYVFVTPDGQPLLEASTGNPLLDHLPLMVTVHTSVPAGPGAGQPDLSSPTVVSPGAPAGAPGEDIVTKVLGAQPAEIGVVPTASVPPLGPVEGTAQLPASTLPLMSAPAVEIVEAIPVESVASTARLGKLLPFAAILGGAALVGGGGGSDSAPAPPEYPIPEPASITALALAASAAIALRRRRQPRR